MYRSSEVYERIKRVIIKICVDYNITAADFPLDEKKICRKMRVKLVPYSSYDIKRKQLLLKCSKYGFFVKETKETPPRIFYNDELGSEGAIRFTIFHELKHYIFNDCDDSEDDLADFFARYFLCPIPYVILMNMNTPEEIMQKFGVSYTAAKNVCSNVEHRREIYGDKLFEYELPLIEQLVAGLNY